MEKNNKVPQGYKDSPLGIIPEEWEVREFNDFANMCKSKYAPQSTETRKCLELEHLTQDTGRILGWIDSSEQKSTKNVFSKGQVLFGKLRPYLRKYWQAQFAGVCSSEIWVLESVKSKCSNDFLYRLIQSERFIQVANVSSGSKMPRADWDYVSSFPFALPSLQEQQKIAEILATWDKAIEKQSFLIEKLELRKRGLMQQLLTGKKRLEGFSGKWQKRNMKELFCIITETNDNEQHAIMTISNKYGFMSQENKFDRVIAGDSLNKYILLQKGDFAYNKGNSKTYPVGCIYKLSDVNSALVPFVYICFRPIVHIYSDFYKYYFINHGLDKQLNQIITSGARGDGLLNVNKEDFFCLTIPFPAFAEQTAIAHILTTTDKEIELARTKLTTLRSQKIGLMQQLLTGKKRINYINS